MSMGLVFYTCRQETQESAEVGTDEERRIGITRVERCNFETMNREEAQLHANTHGHRLTSSDTGENILPESAS